MFLKNEKEKRKSANALFSFIQENDTSSSVVKATTISRLLLKLTSSITNFKMVKPIHPNRLKQKFIRISTKKGGMN